MDDRDIGEAARSRAVMPARVASVRHYGAGGREHGGGIGRFIGYLTEAAAACGECHVVTDTRGARLSLASPGVFFLSLCAMGWDRITAPGRIHHIHLAGRGSTVRKLVLTGLARLIGCRYLVHLHDFEYRKELTRRSSAMRGLIAGMFRCSEAVIVLGKGDWRLVTETLKVAQDRVEIFHNCVPDPGPPKALGAEVPTILFLGRLCDRKGVPELLAALAQVADRPWNAVLAGDGSVAEYRGLAEQLGLGERVRLTGWLGSPEVTALCREAEMLVLPSHAEGLAMAVLEGMAHGLAVITTRVGAHDEVIEDGQNGVFVPVGDPAALACALAALLDDRDRRRRLGAAARASYLNGFRIEGQLHRLQAIYNSIRLDELPAGAGTRGGFR